MKKIAILMTWLLLIGSSTFASDVAIDDSGNIITGTSNSYGNLKVTGDSGEHAVAGEASGTGAAGVYGKSTDSNNYGHLGSDDYGVYGNSSSGKAGYFDGDARVTGNLTVDGTITGETDPTVNANVKDGIDWTELSGIPAGFADGIDNSSGSDIWTQSASDIYFNTGNVGIGTASPAGKLDVNGSLCLGGSCRTTWPTGAGSGAFTDSGSAAYYTGGNVGIGTTSPVSLGSTDTRVLHLLQPVDSLDYTAAGIRLEVGNKVTGGISSAYSQLNQEGGIFVGALSEHRVGFITNSMEKMTLATNGYLGIDTTSPQQPLHVQGNAYISGALGIGTASPTNNLQVSGSNALFSSDSGDFKMAVSKNLESDIASIIFQDGFSGRAELGLTLDNDLHFKVSSDGTSFIDAMIIEHTTGNVGIGEQGSGAKLKVLKTTPFAYAIYAESLGDNAPAIGIEKDGIGPALYIRKLPGESGNGIFLEHYGSDPALVIQSGDFGSLVDALVVESNGNIGIGTATPVGTLDVNGTIYQRGGSLHADYVFTPEYELESIDEHSVFMWENKHLKAIPKAKVDKNGEDIVEVGSHRKGIVEELEKAHIYIEQLHKQIKEQNIVLQLLEKRLTQLEAGN